MRIERVEGDWSARKTWQSPAGKWCGIAIGPGSTEGIVRVDQTLVQAGRPLPLKAGSYNLTHDTDAEVGLFTSISVLEVMLFEDPAELACEMARANGRTFVKDAAITAAAFTRVLVVPYVGRRHARISAKVTGAIDLGYQIVGRFYSPGEGAVREETLVTVEPVVGIRKFVENVGGYDNAEVYHELALELKGSAVATANAEGETTGEMGCR